jgi:uncharacterized protein HemX
MGLAYSIARVDILRARIVNLQIEQDALKETVASLRGQIAALDTNKQSDATQLAQLQTEMSVVNDSVSALRGGAAQAQRQSLRSEALYLLRLASDQLQLAHDASLAVNTLAAAESVLRESGDVAIDAIHQQVLKALDQLRALPDNATGSIDLQLNAAEQQVATLRLAGAAAAKNAGSSTALREDGISRAWATLKQALSKLFIVRQADAENSALLDTEEQLLRRRHLQLLLLNARLALHLHDQTGFVTAIHDASSWLLQHFERGDPQIAQFNARLNQLAQQNIAPLLPDLSAAIQALTRQLHSGTASP